MPLSPNFSLSPTTLVGHLSKTIRDNADAPIERRYHAMQRAVDDYVDASDEECAIRQARQLIEPPPHFTASATPAIPSDDVGRLQPHYPTAVRFAANTLRRRSPRFEVAQKLTRRQAARLIPEPGAFSEPTPLGRPWEAPANLYIDRWATRMALQMSADSLQILWDAWQQALPSTTPPVSTGTLYSQQTGRLAPLTPAEEQRFAEIAHCLYSCFGPLAGLRLIGYPGPNEPHAIRKIDTALKRRLVLGFAAADLNFIRQCELFEETSESQAGPWGASRRR